MGQKIKFILPMVLVFCLIASSGFAAELSSMISPNSFSVDHTNLAGDQTRTLIFSMNNTEVYDLIANVSNSTNLTHETDSSNYMPISFNLANLTRFVKLSGANVTTYSIDVTINDDFVNETGTYEGWIDVYTEDEAGGHEQSYEIPIVVNVTDTINMTALNAINTTGSDVVLEGNVMNANVIPTYWNGAYVSDLDETNFTISIEHINVSSLTNANTTLNVTGVVDAGTHYTLTTTALPTTLLGGNYSVIFGLANSTFTGSDTSDNEFAIDQTALKMSKVSCADATLYVGNTTTCSYKLINYGYRSVDYLNISYNMNPIGGLTVSPVNMASLVNLTEQNSSSNFTTVTGGTVGTRYLSINVTNSTSSDLKWDVQNISVKYTVSVSTTTEDTSTDDTTTTTTSSGGGGAAELLSGFTHKLEIVGPDSFTIDQGDSVTKKIEVKNVGSFQEYDVKLSVSGIPSSWYMVETAEQNVIMSLSKEYSVLIKAPKSAEPKSYTITFKASNSMVDGIGTTVMDIMPSEDTKVMIAANYTNYSKWFDTIMTAYNGTSLDEGNATVVEDMLSEITGLLVKADSHIGLGEYFEAYRSLTEARTLLLEAEDIVGIKESGVQFLAEGKLMIVAGLVLLTAIGAGLYFGTKSGKLKLNIPKMSRGRSFGSKSNVSLNLKRKHAGMKLKAEEMRKKLSKKKETIRKGEFKLPQLRSSE